MWWTLVSAAIASATALLIAFRVYPWQKQKDRDLQVNRDLSDAYVELVSQIDRLASASQSKDEAEGYALIFRAKTAINRILLLECNPPQDRLDNVFTALADIFETSTGATRHGNLSTDSYRVVVENANWLLNHHRKSIHKNENREVALTLFISNKISAPKKVGAKI